MRRRTESNRLLCASLTWLVLLAMCMPVSAQKNLVASIDYEYELALYRPKITLAHDGSHAVAWESFARLQHGEEWQIGAQVFSKSGTPLDEPIYLRDPESCINEEVEGYRGVQNADLTFNKVGDLLIAMEPVLEIFDDRVHKYPRTILSKMDRTGYVTFQDVASPCEMPNSGSVDDFESERPRLDLIPQTGEVVLISNQQANSRPGKKTAFQTISFAEQASHSLSFKPANAADAFHEAWHDVATNPLFSGYSWQRCYDNNDADDCDVVVKFVPHVPGADVVHTTKPIRVNTGDEHGVLNNRPAIAMNDSGESVVVWIDYRHGEHGDIFAQRFDTKGWPVGENLRLSEGNGHIDDAESVGPEVAIKDDGSYMVVWTQDDGTGRKAYGRLVSGKDNLELPFLLDSDPQVESISADVTSNGIHFGYTWISTNDAGSAIYYWISDSDSFVSRSIETRESDLSFSGYPNPFSEETTLEYELNNEGHVTLIIYDLLGREVKKLIDKWQAPGSYLVNVPAGELAIGYYVTKLQQGDLQFSKVLIRTP